VDKENFMVDVNDVNTVSELFTVLDTNWLGLLTGVFALIGSLYSLARIIVILTPTPKDDIVVTKIGGWLGLIGRIFGLNLGQGIRKG